MRVLYTLHYFLIVFYYSLSVSALEICGNPRRHIPLSYSLVMSPTLCMQQKNVIFMGDSTMVHTAQQFSSFFNCSRIMAATRCDFAAYYNISASNISHSLPIPIGVGPLANGKTNRGCMDCSGCESRSWACDSTTIEFLGVEFAKDVEYQTGLYNFTQENVIKGYLAKKAPPFVVIFNTGLHDMGAGSPDKIHLHDTYGDNLEWLVEMLHETLSKKGTRLVWLSTSAVREDKQPEGWRNITNNQKVEHMNAEASRIMQKWNIAEVDQYAVTRLPYFQAMNVDGVHYGAEFYKSTALELLKLVCKSSLFMD